MQRTNIKVTFRCNNHCQFCAGRDEREKFPDKTTDELKQVRKTHEAIVFSGGEPTIRKDLPKLVRLAKDLRFRAIQIQTNGRMFTYRKFCQDLIKEGGKTISFGVSLHGHNSKLHDSLTGSSGSFNQTATGIKNLKSLGQQVLTNTVITKPNYKHLP